MRHAPYRGYAVRSPWFHSPRIDVDEFVNVMSAMKSDTNMLNSVKPNKPKA